MKKIIIIFLSAVVVALGIYAVKLSLQKSSASPVSQPDSNPQPGSFSTPDKIASTDVVIKITETAFEPQEITIKKGQRVVFFNQSSSWVWPASDPHPLHTGYPGFDPKEPFKNGETWEFIFDRVGNWGFHDHLLPSRKGTVKVTD